MYKRCIEFYFKPISLLLLIILGTNAYALQTKEITNNQTVSAVIANNNKTRIFVDGDRISALRGTPDAYIYENDDVNGQVFITPTSAFKNKAFSLFVTTEKGNTYGLILTPQKALSDSIMLVPNNPSIKITQNTNLDDDEQMIHLLQAMVTHRAKEDDTEIAMLKAPKAAFKTISIQFQGSYQEGNWQGQIYNVTNLLTHPIKIAEKEFYQSGLRAIALTTHILLPKETLLMYVMMRSNRNDG